MNEIRIGPYRLASNVLLAPMAGVTDRPFRMLCRRLGAGLAASEMLTADVRLWNTPKSRRRMDHSGEPSPRVVQIAGYDPQMMAEAARRCVDAGAEIIDVNMGCPAKKVCNRAAGSALLRDESLVGRILETVVRAVEAPVTLKTRTGWDAAHRNGVRIAQIAESAGIRALAIHGRTRADLYGGQAEFATVRAIKHAVAIPVFANGDIDCAARARAVLAETGCDGVMIGRAAQGKPWIFDEVNFFLTRGETRDDLPPQNVRDIMRAHLEELYSFYGDETGVRVARKHMSWYCRRHPGPEALRTRAMRETTPREQLSAALDLFDAGVDRAA
ncbi:MAG: tRNA dihydrouridine synthase DusB [Gammaproteobacteria bacterium]|nr:tRNA dihydrouridine synthase DusB [Gammaproteobacteria bacterium]MDE2306333.1 tRNA dihydrouridine synthase DusB [Gammaproteobacteria bacterium]